VGFEISVDENQLDGFSLEAVRAMDQEMIELIYRIGEEEIRIRKVKAEDDINGISGDYNEYSETNTELYGDIEVATKGNAGKVSVAEWSINEYNYSLTANNAEGLDSSTTGDIIKSIQ
jgi:hypothetical protein